MRSLHGFFAAIVQPEDAQVVSYSHCKAIHASKVSYSHSSEAITSLTLAGLHSGQRAFANSFGASSLAYSRCGGRSQDRPI